MFAIEIFRFCMNATLVYHGIFKVIAGDDDGSSQTDIRLLSTFDMCLTTAQFCSVIFAFNQCAHLTKLILQLKGA